MAINASQEQNLRNNSYHGVILPDKDPKNQGRYKVHIPELHPLVKDKEGIWCKNQNHSWRMSPSEDYVYGSYFPLQPGTKVLVKFYQNDFHSGYIEKIVSDQVIKTNPKIGCGNNPEATSDRDDMYVIFKTPKYHNLFAVLEKTTDGSNGLVKQLIPNSLHLYYNYRRSTYIMNEDGIHFFSMNNYGKTIEGHSNIWINQNDKLYIQGNKDCYVNGSTKNFSAGGVDNLGKSHCHNTYAGPYDIQSAVHFAVDAPAILFNCGATSPATQAQTNKGEDEIVNQNKLDMRIVSHQKRDDTYYGSPKNSTVGGAPPLPKMEGEKELSRLAQGQSDRYGSVGQSQVGGSPRPFPPYPSRGGKTQMINLPAISSAVASPLSNLKGLTLPGLSPGLSSPNISSVTPATQQIANSINSQVTGAVSSLTSGVTTGLNKSLSPLNFSNSVASSSNKLSNLLTTVPSYNTLSSLPSVGPNNTISQIIGNAQSIQDLNDRLNNSINNTISSNFTNPVTSVINNSTMGINQIKNLIETDNVADMITDATGTTGIGYRVADEIRNLTNGNAIAGVMGYIPGATAAASIINLVGNDLGLGGILSDIACNDNFNFELALDNPLDEINKALENLKASLEAMLEAFDPSKLQDAIMNNLGLDAIQDALNSLGQLPNCQTIAKTLLVQSSALSHRAAAQHSNTSKGWSG